MIWIDAWQGTEPSNIPSSELPPRVIGSTPRYSDDFGNISASLVLFMYRCRPKERDQRSMMRRGEADAIITPEHVETPLYL